MQRPTPYDSGGSNVERVGCERPQSSHCEHELGGAQGGDIPSGCLGNDVRGDDAIAFVHKGRIPGQQNRRGGDGHCQEICRRPSGHYRNEWIQKLVADKLNVIAPGYKAISISTQAFKFT